MSKLREWIRNRLIRWLAGDQIVLVNAVIEGKLIVARKTTVYLENCTFVVSDKAVEVVS